MNWQLLLVGLVVAAAIGYLGLRGWRTWIRPTKSSCGGGCGCDKGSAPAPGAIIPSDQLALRRRK